MQQAGTGGGRRSHPGRKRQNGVLAANGELVAIHDAARPFVSQAVIQAVLLAAAQQGAAGPGGAGQGYGQAGVGRGWTHRAPDCMVQATPDRSTCMRCRRRSALSVRRTRGAGLAGPEKARLVTDDCSLFELTGRPVQLTQGDYANIKITTREDLPRPEAKGECKMRIGHGYDVHRLVEGRKLILGGVEVPFEKGLDGHSDADVLTHAVMDAVLGGAAFGDIGRHFPDTDPAYAGADSLELARH